ncbi:hypothetical protein ACLB2K_047815 [Fragaria x ananassa]
MLGRKSRSCRKAKQTRKRRCRIAELPEFIQESILSLIPLADAAKTSLHYKGHKIDSLTVRDEDGDVVLDRWIRFAMTKGVEELNLHGGRKYVFPHQLLLSEQVNAGSRVNLKYLTIVCAEGIIRPPSDFSGFSQLVTLYLSRVIIHPTFTSNLFSIFASLESLTLHIHSVKRDPDYDGTGTDDLNIVAGDRLTELKVRYWEGKINISARNLASLEYIGDQWSSLSIKSTPRVRLERIYLLDMVHRRPSMLPHVLKQFAKCSKLKSLCMRMDPETLINFSMPAFGNLRKLEVDICSRDASGWDRSRYNNDDILLGFLGFLKAAPLLEELVTALLIDDL